MRRELSLPVLSFISANHSWLRLIDVVRGALGCRFIRLSSIDARTSESVEISGARSRLPP